MTIGYLKKMVKIKVTFDIYYCTPMYSFVLMWRSLISPKFNLADSHALHLRYPNF
ncbi:hypothetical protein MSIBF_A1680004 [groundwater metagenome]|uniref:Uncharacterized protein n=1 Tax=groundwater metagenome TaxID=717931 RepID=A0A098E714_9ZZZZ